jgi:uncharacterized protein (DUF2237 family)
VVERNVLGVDLEPCGTDPMTGFFRDGRCSTSPEDLGSHTICAVVTAEFLNHQRSIGNDLSTPMPQYRFPGLVPGDRWCVTAGSPADGATLFRGRRGYDTSDGHVGAMKVVGDLSDTEARVVSLNDSRLLLGWGHQARHRPTSRAITAPMPPPRTRRAAESTPNSQALTGTAAGSGGGSPPNARRRSE